MTRRRRAQSAQHRSVCKFGRGAVYTASDNEIRGACPSATCCIRVSIAHRPKRRRNSIAEFSCTSDAAPAVSSPVLAPSCLPPPESTLAATVASVCVISVTIGVPRISRWSHSRSFLTAFQMTCTVSAGEWNVTLYSITP